MRRELPSLLKARRRQGGGPIGTRSSQQVRECSLCGRLCPEAIFEKHHLRTRRGDRTLIESICRECHKTIHGLFSNKELRDPRLDLDSIEGLLAKPQLQRALDYIRKVPAGAYMRMRQSSARGSRRR